MLDIDTLRELIPKKQKNLVTENIVKIINETASDELIADEFKKNFVTYTNVISSGKYSLEEYNNAVHFLTMIMIGDSEIDAYSKVFPDRYKRLIEKGVDRSKISSYVSNYKNTKLVVQLLEQSMVPTYIVNAPLYQDALNHSIWLMYNAQSETVQQKSAEAVMVQLKAPEAAKLEVDISVNKGSVVDDYEQVMLEVAERKREAMLAGADVKSLANISPIKETVIDVEEE